VTKKLYQLSYLNNPNYEQWAMHTINCSLCNPFNLCVRRSQNSAELFQILVIYLTKVLILLCRICYVDGFWECDTGCFELQTQQQLRAATFNNILYIHVSVHRNSILIRSNKMQQYAGIYLLQNHSTCFGCPSYQSSGVHKTVTAASGTGHNICATTFLQRGL
jgi:hypothetical protein